MHLTSVSAVFCLCVQKAGAKCEKSGIFNSKSVLTYRTRIITKKAYRTSVPYYLAKIEAYRTVPTYRTVLLSLTTVTDIYFRLKVVINSLAEFIDFSFRLSSAYR